MNEVDMYLHTILQTYAARDLTNYSAKIHQLKNTLRTWANDCYIDTLDSGSRAKGTAISIASDVDFLISLTSNCNENNGGLNRIYNSLYDTLSGTYPKNISKQNVSVRINLGGLKVDITPARKQPGNTNDHSLWVSKLSTWRQTNVQKHISDVFNSGRTDEIKLLKIWRELNRLDFPSIYLEYLLINIILRDRPRSGALHDNFFHVLLELAKPNNNPLFSTVVDPVNTNNILSDLLTNAEKNKIIAKAKAATTYPNRTHWRNIIW